MALSYKARRRLSIVILLLWLPLYLVLALIVLASLPRMNILIEVAIYILAGVIWLLPFRFVFLGVGKADPDAEPKKFADDDFIAMEKAKRREVPGSRR